MESTRALARLDATLERTPASPAFGRLVARAARVYRAAAAASRPLALFSAGSLGLAVLAAAGIAVDGRLLLGESVWLKPLKFALSNALFAFTLALVLGEVAGHEGFVRRLGRVAAGVLAVENGLIFLQAARGVRSHFNAATLFDAGVVSLMGLSILVLWIYTIRLALLLWRQGFADRAWGWALRFGVAVTVAGAGMGGLMTRPTGEQIERVAARRDASVLGGHTVGAVDGGPGIPAIHWSATHGDLRVPHFFGLHAMQLLPLAALALRRRRLTDGQQARLALTAGLGYAALFALLIWQALRGESVAQPGALTLWALAGWAVAVVSTSLWSLRSAPRSEVNA